MRVSPLPYHRAVADIVARENPALLAVPSRSGHGSADALDQARLRTTCRLEAAAHPQLHAAVARAAEAIELTVPVETYADQDNEATYAELVFVHDRAVVLFSGRILELLDLDELCAVVGHELAHHTLWTDEGGRYLTTARLLTAAESDARTQPAYLETARRYRLATELYADRAALAAAGSLASTVSGLLKVSTSPRQVHPEVYLRQAVEVDFTSAGAATTHLEPVLRAWALQQWSEQPGADADARVAAAITPELDLASLDLPGQDRLRARTLELVAAAVSLSELRSPGVLELADQYGVTAPPEPTDFDELRLEPGAEPLAEDTRRYLAAVLTDLATADSDSDLTTAAAVLALAGRVDLGAEVLGMLTTELDLADRVRDRLQERAEALSSGLR